MTDNEIIKALECHAHRTERNLNCCDCDYIQHQDCSQRMSCDALALINRQNAEIERLTPFEDKIAEFNSHIRVEDMLVFASSLEEWLEFCDNLKAEAYKECIEKVKILNQNNLILWNEQLDNLLKEMGGDNK